MAGDWIKMRTDLAEDPAVIHIATVLQLDEDTVVGKLHRLWSWADSHTTDGNAVSVTETWVDRYVRAPGFALAMQAARWLHLETEGQIGISFPNFERHNGKTAKARGLTSKRVATHRNGASVTPALPEKRREEKRRIKKRNPPTPLQGEQALAFDRFWLAYPRKEKKEAAQKAFAKVRAEVIPALMAAVEAQKRNGCLEPRTAEDGRSVVPHASSWLNGRRWEDEPGLFAPRGNLTENTAQSVLDLIKAKENR